VLFLCTGNSGRSQLGEALMERLGEGAIEVFSAGSHPKPLHPMALQVMREHGLDIAGRRSKRLEEFTGERFDYVISLCDRVREECPEFPGSPDVVHWSMPDPAREGDTDAERRQAFQRTFDELAARIPFLLQGIADSPLRQQEVK
jgi:protein-tyrosine-phosphatase